MQDECAARAAELETVRGELASARAQASGEGQRVAEELTAAKVGLWGCTRLVERMGEYGGGGGGDLFGERSDVEACRVAWGVRIGEAWGECWVAGCEGGG